MLRARYLLPFVLGCACATSGSATEDSAAPSQSSAIAANETPASGHALDATLMKDVAGSDTVYRIKIRVDESGQVIKQAVYHRDDAAVPEAVRALATARFPGAPVTHYETEVYADVGRVFEVEVDNNGTACELAAQADGTELYTECHVDPESLSAAAKATIEAVAPGGKVLEAETKKGPNVAEETTVEVEHGEHELYLRLAADGSLIQALRRVPALIEVPLP